MFHTSLRLTHVSYTATAWFGAMRVYDGREQRLMQFNMMSAKFVAKSYLQLKFSVIP